MARLSPLLHTEINDFAALRFSWRCAVLVALGLLSEGIVRAGTSVAPLAEREAAVTQARAGDAKGGLTLLQSLLQRYPDDSRVLADTTIAVSYTHLDVYKRQPSILTTPQRRIRMASLTPLPLPKIQGSTMDDRASMFTTASCSWETSPRPMRSR